MRPTALALTLASMLILLTAAPAYACTCSSVNICRLSSEASAIFVGRVVDIEQAPPKEVLRFAGTDGAIEVALDRNLLVHLQVEKAFKGVPAGGHIDVQTGMGISDCGVPFERSERYLVFAHGESGNYSTSVCSHTRHISQASDDLQSLEALSQGKRDTRIVGKLEFIGTSLGPEFYGEGAPDVPIEVRGNSLTLTTTSGSDGRFRLRDLPDGNYTIRPVVRGASTPASREITIRWPDSCSATANFALGELGKISGRVFDSNGRRAGAGMVVWLVDSEWSGNANAHMLSATTDDSGTYTFEGLRSARYLTGVALAKAPDANTPYSPTFSPGVSHRTLAQVLDLTSMSNVTTDIQLSAPMPTTIIRGVVRTDDGKPIPNVWIQIFDKEFPNETIGPYNVLPTDEGGAFSRTVIANRQYRIRVRLADSRDGRPRYSGLVEVVARENAPLLTITTAP
jgi:hypothetical protein